MTFLELSEDSREPGLSNICPEGVQTGEYKYYFSVFTFHFSHQDSSLPQHLPHHSRGSGALPGGLQTSPLQRAPGLQHQHQDPHLHPSRHPRRPHRQHHQVLRGPPLQDLRGLLPVRLWSVRAVIQTSPRLTPLTQLFQI